MRINLETFVAGQGGMGFGKGMNGSARAGLDKGIGSFELIAIWEQILH
ncbi:MAG: hypothetical protein WCG66_07790 [bacterium]